MTDALIRKLRKLAVSRGADRTAPWWDGGLPPRATRRQVEAEERLLTQSLHPLHRRALQEVANGGFGPAYGLLGVEPGMVDSRARTLAGLRQDLLSAEEALFPIVPLLEWGSGTWAFCDVPSGDVLSVADGETVRVGMTLEEWLAAWCRGEDLTERLYRYHDQSIVNPFTKQRETLRLACGLAGTPYQPTRG